MINHVMMINTPARQDTEIKGKSRISNIDHKLYSLCFTSHQMETLNQIKSKRVQTASNQNVFILQ